MINADILSKYVLLDALVDGRGLFILREGDNRIGICKELAHVKTVRDNTSMSINSSYAFVVLGEDISISSRPSVNTGTIFV